MKSLLPVREFLQLAQSTQRPVAQVEPAPATTSYYNVSTNCAFVSGSYRQHEFSDRNCIVLAMAGPRGGTRAIGAMTLEQARDLHQQLSEAILALEKVAT